jgi:hypothetical protein
MARLLAGGLTLQVAGLLIAWYAVPRTTISLEGPEEVGDRTVMLLGVLAFGLGGVLSLIAVVAFGVLLGMRARSGD